VTNRRIRETTSHVGLFSRTKVLTLAKPIWFGGRKNLFFSFSISEFFKLKHPILVHHQKAWLNDEMQSIQKFIAPVVVIAVSLAVFVASVTRL